MSGLFELSSETANSARIEEQLDGSSIVQDDYEKLKQENESYQQEVYVLRLKLEASNAFVKELQESNEGLEQSFAQHTAKQKEIFSVKEEKYKIKKKEYENHIANLETNAVEKKQEIMELQEELRKCKDFISKCSHCTTFIEDTSSIQYKEKIEELIEFLQNEEKKRIKLEEKLMDIENQYQEMKDILQTTKEQLIEKDEALQNTREELAMNRLELESLKMIPASDTRKGNSLFAEVEDRRQMLLDKMKALQYKYNETKQILNMKITEIDLLRSEKSAMVKKWETDVIDTLQDKMNLLDKYKNRISDLENKLKAEIKNNKEIEEIRSTNDNFNYAQSLLIMKKKELKQLNEKIEQQAMQMLIQEETNNDISTQLRFWQTKAMSMEVQLLSIKAQLQTERTKDNDTNLEAIKNCKTSDTTDSEKTWDNLKIISDNVILKNDASQEKSIKMLEKLAIDRNASEQKQFDGKVLRFVTDTKEIEKQSQKEKKRLKQYKYPIVSITDELKSH